MIRSLLLFLILVSSACIAQPQLRRNYLAYDTCPEPLKNHIAKRTIYKSCGNVPGWCQADTVIEKYDKQGHMTSLENRSVDGGGNPHSLLHYFTYDALGRITRDTGIYDKMTTLAADGFLVTYEYPDLRSATEHASSLGNKTVTYRRFEKDFSVSDLLEIQNGTDTLTHSYTHGDTTITKSWVRYANQPLTFSDSSIVIKTKESLYTYSSKSDKDMWHPVAVFTRYDASGRVAYKLIYEHGKVLVDSVVATYDQKGQLIKETTYSTDGYGKPYARYYAEYTYTNKLLTESREWSEQGPPTAMIRRYTYNKKGLRTKWEFIWVTSEQEEKIQVVEVWEYEFY